TRHQTYYLTLDLSIRDFLERRTDIVHNTRGGYRVWYNPLFNVPEPRVRIEDADDNDGPGRADAELDTITMNRADDETPIDPLLEQYQAKPSAESKNESKPDSAVEEEIQILDLHSKEPFVSYRNHVFRGSWAENIGTEMIFTPHDDKDPLPAIRHLSQNIDLLAASASRVNFKEIAMIPKTSIPVEEYEETRDSYNKEDDIPERYKRNGGIYVHIGGDKTGQRQPQAHFLEDLIALKRKRGETDEVTIQPLETRQNKLMVDDEEEERRRRKLQRDYDRNLRWRNTRDDAPRSGPVEDSYVPRDKTGSAIKRAMVYHLRRAAIVSASISTILIILWAVPLLIKPTQPNPEERERDEQWVNSSPYWIDRQACRWMGLCGVQHLKWDAPALPGRGNGTDDAGDLAFDALKALVVGWSEDWTYIEKTDVSSWEAAPLIRSPRKQQQNATEAELSASGAKILEDIPQYVLDHAPLVHLYSGEYFWPSDIAEHVKHMRPLKGNSSVNTSKPLDLGNLAVLNAENDTVFLSSADDVESRPEWLHSHVGIPTPFTDKPEDNAPKDGDDQGWRDAPRRKDGTTWWDADRDHPPHRISDPRRLSERKRRPLQRRHSQDAQHPMIADPLSPSATSNEKDDPDKNKPDAQGYSKGPAVLVLVDKGAGIVDAFWFFFYSYNLGQTVLNIRFGNHVGDWEHCAVRFEHGEPRAMALSQHAGGQAYAWKALEKRSSSTNPDKPPRPVIYSAVGSHAMYASSGLHPYVLPFKMLKDITDKGPLWDPTLNNYAYWFDYEVDREEAGKMRPGEEERTSLTPVEKNPDAPTSWFHFEGYWGDDTYPLKDKRQWRLFGEYHYATGPRGPKFKNLARRGVCQSERCTIIESIEAGKKGTWYS
ncbi:hypothetical protein B0T19DRAFT_357413, partial [Cercophora scortea]